MGERYGALRRGLRMASILALVLAIAPAAASASKLRLIGSKRLGARLVELTLRTPALSGDTNVRVLLPAAYRSSRTRRYPVLYLLHGSVDDYRSWTNKGDAEHLTAGLPLIVVMPNAGNGGFYSDWFNSGAGGPPEWETYHVRQLIPWIDAHYRTVASRRGRATAGLSMGGFGAMTYPARHPDEFVAAASFSGAVNTNEYPPTGEADESTFDGGAPYSTWGTRQSQEIRWRAHNPWDLAGNLRGLRLTIRTGNGQPGGPYGCGDPIEAYVHQASLDLHQKLAQLRIPHVWDDYGPGGHDWPYWQRDLKQTLPSLLAAFARPPRAPSPFTFQAVEPMYEVYGWRVAVNRAALEWSRLQNASRTGFTLSGSGSGLVTTARLYRAGRVYRVAVGKAVRHIAAGRHGRLRIAVPLGPANPLQEDTAGAA